MSQPSSPAGRSIRPVEGVIQGFTDWDVETAASMEPAQG